MASSESDTAGRPIRLERPESGIATITLNRSSGPNVIDEGFCDTLLQACEELARDGSLHAVVLRAEGQAFCVGANLGALQIRMNALTDYVGQLIDRAHAAVLALRRIPVPVIASVHAVAAGGGFSLAMACDHVIAAPPARFVAAYPALGCSPDCGLTHTLTVRVGSHKALSTVLDTRPLDLPQAMSLGILDEVAESGALETAVLTAARRLCAVPRSALVQAKALFLQADLPQFALRLDQEKAAFLRCVAEPTVRQRIADFGSHRRES